MNERTALLTETPQEEYAAELTEILELRGVPAAAATQTVRPRSWGPAALDAYIDRRRARAASNSETQRDCARANPNAGTPLPQGIAYNQRAGSFDFIPYAMTGLTKNEISWRISDHCTLWAEFRLSQD